MFTVRWHKFKKDALPQAESYEDVLALFDCGLDDALRQVRCPPNLGDKC